MCCAVYSSEIWRGFSISASDTAVRASASNDLRETGAIFQKQELENSTDMKMTGFCKNHSHSSARRAPTVRSHRGNSDAPPVSSTYPESALQSVLSSKLQTAVSSVFPSYIDFLTMHHGIYSL